MNSLNIWKYKEVHDNKDVFLLDLLNLYNKTILRGLENLLQFFIGRYNLSGIDYADDTVLMADSEKKNTERIIRHGSWREQEEKTD